MNIVAQQHNSSPERESLTHLSSHNIHRDRGHTEASTSFTFYRCFMAGPHTLETSLTYRAFTVRVRLETSSSLMKTSLSHIQRACTELTSSLTSTAFVEIEQPGCIDFT